MDFEFAFCWFFWTVVLEKILESPLDCKEIQSVNPKGIQSWIFIGRTDSGADTIILWPPNVKNWLIWKDPDAEKDWRQEEKGTTEDEMVGWHHGLSGHEFEQALGIGDGQGSLVCCSPWGHKESDMTEQLDWTDWKVFMCCLGQSIHVCRLNGMARVLSIDCKSLPALSEKSSPPSYTCREERQWSWPGNQEAIWILPPVTL